MKNWDASLTKYDIYVNNISQPNALRGIDRRFDYCVYTKEECQHEELQPLMFHREAARFYSDCILINFLITVCTINIVDRKLTRNINFTLI